MQEELMVDLHIHTIYSDGTLSPNEVLEIATTKCVKIIAITDHNQLDGARELQRLASAYSITCVPGVELDASYCGTNLHILGYNVNLDSGKFNEFTVGNAALLESANVELIKKMELNQVGVSLSEYTDFNYERKLGGWKALHYFISKGIAKDVGDAFSFYSLYGSAYNCIAFPEVNEVCKQIHDAGGVAILAHPGKVLKTSDLTRFKKELVSLAMLGLDGIECFYPAHTPQIISACISVCKELSLFITAGSDCHGDFEDTEIGELNCSLTSLNLGSIIGGIKTNE